MLDSVKAKRTGDKQADRQTLEQAFAGFLKGMENEVRSMLPELRKQLLEPRHRAMALHTQVSRVVEGDWLNEVPVRIRNAALEKARFRCLGCFQSSAVPSSQRVSYIHPAQECTASVIKTPRGAVMCIGYTFEDGSEEEYTDSALLSSISTPPWLKLVNRPDLPPEDLIRLAAEQRRKSGLVVLKADDYVKEWEADWFRCASRLAETGGQSAAYFKEVLRLGDSPEDVEKLEQLRRGEVDKSLCKWLRLQPGLPFDVEAVLDSLVIMHDELSSDMLAACWWCATEDVGVRDREFQGGSPRRVFATVNTRRGNKLRLVLQKTTNFQADFYLPSPA